MTSPTCLCDLDKALLLLHDRDLSELSATSLCLPMTSWCSYKCYWSHLSSLLWTTTLLEHPCWHCGCCCLYIYLLVFTKLLAIMSSEEIKHTFDPW